MAENASLVRLDDQPPVIRLILSLLFTVVTGTIFFWLFVYCGSLIFGTSVSEMTVIPSPGAGEKQINILRYVQASQQIGLFLIPSILLAHILKRGGESYLKMDRSPGPLNLILIVILVIIIIPVISWTGSVNSGMELPGWLSGIERMMRDKEGRASDIMKFLLTTNGPGEASINLLILAVIPAIAEELFFRGIIQQLFTRAFGSPHSGIWITAILFSAIHFQFYGFFPRMILGLLFGYLFLWTDNLWSAIIPHFLNNAIPVVLTFISEQKVGVSQLTGDTKTFPLIQMILSAVILYYIWYFSRSKPD